MIDGVAYEVTLGTIYNDKKRYSVRKNANAILGIRADFLKKKVLDRYLLENIFKAATSAMDNLPKLYRHYENRTTDLMKSIGVGLFLDGVFQKEYQYRNTQGKRESSRPIKRHTVTPSKRFADFYKSYECKYNKGFSVVFAATMPYAPLLEQGMHIGMRKIAVLYYAVNALSAKVREIVPTTVNKEPVYRYIITGKENKQGQESRKGKKK